jgi:hypothetical protein
MTTALAACANREPHKVSGLGANKKPFLIIAEIYRAGAHPMSLNPTSIVFSFLISNRAEIFFGASWALRATFKLIKRVIKIFEVFCFWAAIFFGENSTFYPGNGL